MAAHGGPRRGATGGGDIISRGARVLTTRCASLFTQCTDDLTTYGSLCAGPSGTAHSASPAAGMGGTYERGGGAGVGASIQGPVMILNGRSRRLAQSCRLFESVASELPVVSGPTLRVLPAPHVTAGRGHGPLSRLSTVVVDNIDMTKLLPVTLTHSLVVDDNATSFPGQTRQYGRGLSMRGLLAGRASDNGIPGESRRRKASKLPRQTGC